MHICICSPNYPTQSDPVYSFVGQLLKAMNLYGVSITAIAPQSIVRHFIRHTVLHPTYRRENNGNGAFLEIYQPFCLSFGGRFERLNDWLERLAIRLVCRKMKSVPDAFYGHFWHSAYKLYPIASQRKKPLFVATGESRITITDVYPVEKLKSFTEKVTGVICVSSKNKEESISLGLTTEDRCIVLPNAIDNTLFYHKDKLAIRVQHNIPKEAFVIVFVGAFIPRKGPDRVAMAIESIKDGFPVYSFFIGAPHENENSQPECENILFKGRLPHNELPEYLSMADVFVLPTLEEGCCNAIIEAMACGLPIISSDRPFNYDVLDETNSIMVEPMDIDAIRAAIIRLRDDNVLRKKMSESSLKKASSLTIDQRAGRIIDFMKQRSELLNND